MKWVAFDELVNITPEMWEYLLKRLKMEHSVKAWAKRKTINAIRWDGTNEPFIRKFAEDNPRHSNINILGNNDLQVWNKDTTSWITVPINGWIIRGIKGELYPLSEEMFQQSFDIAIDTPEKEG